ncbi:helix-turn-helix domain-containing protein [Streptomyces sp. NPDC088354]|uniref:helix-turn-helix domain-containing protein n=1 Tax=Streptomyces sp. NPDC088354 TaxID=3365856 RepID=UPI0037FE3015
MVLRARIVLLAAAGAGNSEIAGRLSICEDTARKWRRRYWGQRPGRALRRSATRAAPRVPHCGGGPG